jgi:hypothetical protein
MNSKTLYFEDVDLGDEIGPVERIITDEQVIEFVKLREIEFESGPSRFTSKEVAISQGLTEAIVPGAMNIALMSQLLTGWAENVCLLKIDVVFRKTVPHNTTLIFNGIVTGKNDDSGNNELECDITMQLQDGVKMVIGNSVISLPNRL